MKKGDSRYQNSSTAVVQTADSPQKSLNHLPGSKFKVIPVQPWTGPEGFRRLRFPDFKTTGTWRL